MTNFQILKGRDCILKHCFQIPSSYRTRIMLRECGYMLGSKKIWLLFLHNTSLIPIEFWTVFANNYLIQKKKKTLTRFVETYRPFKIRNLRCNLPHSFLIKIKVYLHNTSSYVCFYIGTYKNSFIGRIKKKNLSSLMWIAQWPLWISNFERTVFELCWSYETEKVLEPY